MHLQQRHPGTLDRLTLPPGPRFAGARNTCVSLSEVQRQIAWVLHSGTIVTLIDACRVFNDSIRMPRSPPISEYRNFLHPSLMAAVSGYFFGRDGVSRVL